ncbi:MAG: hypothetical protein KAH05_04070 [Clostridiales bacterium]|nr:hypothetical protein [Clostridiales bacterium]
MKLQEFEKHRDNLINQLENGIIDKTEFINGNYQFFNKSEMEPFAEITTVDEALYNYQYYNTLAKYGKMLAMELKYKDPFVAVEHRKKADKYYYLKERVTEKLIALYGDKPLKAYYIKVTSKSLKGKLFEIVFEDLDKVILHSKDVRIHNILVKMKKFDKKMQKSIIDDYINSLY